MTPNASTQDPVKVLFNRLPPAQFFLKYGFEPMEGRIIICLEGFIAQCDKIKAAGLAFVDPDTTFLHDKLGLALRQVGRGPVDVIALFLTIVGELALTYGAAQDEMPPGGGSKGHYLRLALWLVSGRRDHEIPVATATSSDPGIMTRLPHTYEHLADLAKLTTKNSNMHCAHCKAECKPPKHCSGCLVDEKRAFLGVAYCGKKCQVDDWKEHKSVCKHRKSLIVAVTQLRALSQLFQSRTCDMTFEILDVKGAPRGAIFMRQFAESHSPSKRWNIIPDALKGEFVFRELARGFLGPQASDVEDYENAIIHHNRCTDNTDVEWPLIERLLKPFCKSITEVLFNPKNLAIVISEEHTSRVINSAISFTHQVLRVELHSGEKFVIDLSGAQYGWHETVALASDYTAARCARVVETRRPGVFGMEDHILWAMQPQDSVVTVAHKLKKEAISAMNGKMQEFESQCRQRGDAPLTRATVDEFVSRLLPVAESAMDKCFDRYKALGMYRLCLNRGGSVRATSSAEMGQIYRDIWLNEEEYGPIQDDAEELMKLWAAKVARSRRGHRIIA